MFHNAVTRALFDGVCDRSANPGVGLSLVPAVEEHFDVLVEDRIEADDAARSPHSCAPSTSTTHIASW